MFINAKTFNHHGEKNEQLQMRLRMMICFTTENDTVDAQKEQYAWRRERESRAREEENTGPGNGKSLGPGSGQRVLEHKDHGITAQEHLGDEPVFVHGLGLLFAWQRNKACQQNIRSVNKMKGQIISGCRINPC
jgi:hypothetical protein